MRRVILQVEEVRVDRVHRAEFCLSNGYLSYSALSDAAVGRCIRSIIEDLNRQIDEAQNAKPDALKEEKDK